MAKSYFLALLLLLFSASALGASSETIQIRTEFSDAHWPASWLIIVRDADSPAVYPYLFDLDKLTNYLVIFTNARNYRVISMMQFPMDHAQISNFCNFPQGIISGLSIDIKVTGILSPNQSSSTCDLRVRKVSSYVVMQKDASDDSQ